MKEFRTGQLVKVLSLKKLEKIGVRGFSSNGCFNKEELDSGECTKNDVRRPVIFPPNFNFEEAKKCDLFGDPFQTDGTFDIKIMKSLCGKSFFIDPCYSYHNDGIETVEGIEENGSIEEQMTTGYWSHIYPWMCEEVTDSNPYKQAADDVLKSLKARLNWYKKAISMKCGEIPWDNHFDWPQCEAEPRNAMAICEWRAAAHELSNTIDMLEAGLRNCE